MDGNLYIEPWIGDVNDPTNQGRKTLLRNRSDPSRGVQVRFAKVSNVWVWQGAYEGALRRAYHPAYTADEEFGTWLHDPANQVQENICWNYNAGGGGTAYLLWNVPAGMDTVEVYYWRTTGNNWGSFQVIIDGADKGALDCDGGNAKLTLGNFAGLSAGAHTVKLQTVGDGPVFIHGIRAYHSTEPPGDGEQRWMPGTLNLVTSASSAIEFAYNFRVTSRGGGYDWIGGLHNSGGGPSPGDGNGKQTNVATTYAADGEAWTLARGYVQAADSIVISRTSDVWYDETSPDVAGLAETYILGGDFFQYSHEFVTRAALDLGPCYAVQACGPETAPKLCVILAEGNRLYDVAADGANADLDAACRRVDLWGNTQGVRLRITANVVTPIEAVFHIRSASQRKTYWRSAGSNVNANPIGTVMGGGWSFAPYLGLELTVPEGRALTR